MSQMPIDELGLVERLKAGAIVFAGKDLPYASDTMSQAAAAIERLLADSRRMDWLVAQHVTVRTPLVYGSRENFLAQQISDEEDVEHRTALREQIDHAMGRARQALEDKP